VVAEGQREERRIKVEKHYLPLYELVVVTPPFVSDTAETIEASVEPTFVTERGSSGNITLQWWAKKWDGLTPMFNDTVLYRNVRSFLSFLI